MKVFLSGFCQPGEEPCPLDPFVVVPDKSKYVDQQTLKLQENPEVIVDCVVISRFMKLKKSLHTLTVLFVK